MFVKHGLFQKVINYLSLRFKTRYYQSVSETQVSETRVSQTQVSETGVSETQVYETLGKRVTPTLIMTITICFLFLR